MRSALSWLSLLILGLALGCGERRQAAPSANPKSENKEAYVGKWKVNNPQLGTYFMTLNEDGSSNSTRTGGEIGQWKWKADHIELEWTPKNLTFYFDSGSSAPKTAPSLEEQDDSVAEKVE